MMLPGEIKIKVCGMSRAANIAELAELQPHYMGFIFYPQSPRMITPVSAELIRYIPEPIKTTGVFVNEEIDKVEAMIRQHGLKAIQLHGNESPEYCKTLQAFNVEVIKAFGIDEDFDFTVLESYVDAVDFFLFDTQTQNYGGSGKVFNWQLLDRYNLQKPYFLSGGIDLQHVEEIKKINDKRLYAIDLNSRFEIEPGLKDINKLQRFLKELIEVQD
ncbi:phosphoribosylanthranilate isomerase [Pedobacter montanisoli]|uniref:N-(5'-phosphoribosyl)anthranilate isomerase n=1 Tax=Pedobacter montanisoli TaxID=2923277 RepID=A0ABS9ZWP8_9SPHI|nr:phosphoribosylanthranilate isomerase [Pedobacter montanisoli]MCJ0742730.1 phosphoribosylanthranilate isomerase [Pedobacter montanisoli]